MHALDPDNILRGDQTKVSYRVGIYVTTSISQTFLDQSLLGLFLIEIIGIILLPQRLTPLWQEYVLDHTGGALA